jgi:hydrogenase maturation protein HypF
MMKGNERSFCSAFSAAHELGAPILAFEMPSAVVRDYIFDCLIRVDAPKRISESYMKRHRPDVEKVGARRIIISGRVQGIGFRPFIYRIGREHRLRGWVKNTQTSVIIEVEGDGNALEQFIADIPEKCPPLAVIESIEACDIPLSGFRDFEIRPSGDDAPHMINVSPDLAICSDCLAELLDPHDRRFRYPFINCTNCGPRFTIIQNVPYDRANTTMARFKMCPQCEQEYNDPANRRYHAQPNACPVCGPSIRLTGHVDSPAQTRQQETALVAEAALQKAIELLKIGKIVAIKGIGGYHLACDALNSDAVHSLRQRKYREDKPFAVMMPSLEVVKQFCYVSGEESALLESYRKPIVLLRKRPGCAVAEEVAPCNPYLGVMLPYTPLHHLLFSDPPRPRRGSLQVLVMTSGNSSQEPIAFRDEDARERLAPIADAFLIHNRDIERRCDDSVTRVARGCEMIMRRARGYAPAPLRLSRRLRQILATGAELKSTFCISKDEYAYVSHHLGDLENFETLEAFEQGIRDFERLFHLAPEYIAYDLHPNYLSTKYAVARPAKAKIPVQHHHAHIVSCMEENGVREPVLGVAFDGTGFGTDGTIWGAEFLRCTYSDFERIAHLEPIALPGGERAIKEPWRVALTYLSTVFAKDLDKLPLPLLQRIPAARREQVLHAARERINAPLASSMGRLFDAVSALLDVREVVNYEGQAAMELEYLATGAETDRTYPFEIVSRAEPARINVAEVVAGIVHDLQAGADRAVIARAFHNTIADIIVSVSGWARERYGLQRVALSGGCFQNVLLLARSIALLEAAGFMVHTHRQLPPNDGCISFGQILIADARLQSEQR